jgi:hypothetical protein
MVTVVLVLNGLLALLCLYVAWQIYCWRSILANVADTLTAAERSTQRVLHSAPPAIATGQVGSAHLRQQYRLLTLQLQQVRQILALLGLGQLVWQQYRRQPMQRRSRPNPDAFPFSAALVKERVNSRREDSFSSENNPHPQRNTTAKSPWMF